MSPDEETIASGSQDGSVRLWDLESQTMIGDPFENHTAEVLSVTFSPNGRNIISGGLDGTVRIWTTGNWEDGLQTSCNRLIDHPSLQQPETSFNAEIALGAKQTCEKYVWNFS